MTEVASLMPPDHRLTAVRHYEAASPAGLELVEPGETIATTKEEEWISKKKTEVTNTKQIETRVKRQVVLEDGKVVEDSGPMVTTNTTEDTETQEHHQTELRKLGDDEPDGGLRALEDVDGDRSAVVAKRIAAPNPDGVVREVKERKVVSREETEEVKETEDVQHLGDITDEDFLVAVRSGEEDLRKVLRSTVADTTLVSTGPRLVHESSKSKKVTDTEDTRELSSVRPDGKIVTETQRTTEHEEIADDELPEDAPEEEDFVKESSQRYLKTREQEDVDYLADGVNIGREMRFKTETMEVERRGDGVNEPDLFDSLSARARRRNNNHRPQPHRYRGIADWSERRQYTTNVDNHSPPTRHSPYLNEPPPHVTHHQRRQSPSPDYRPAHSPVPDYRTNSPVPDYRPSHHQTPPHRYSPTPDYGRIKTSPKREVISVTPTPPQRKKADRYRQRVVEERSRYENGYRSPRQANDRDGLLEEPPPDYSPPSPPPMPVDKKHLQKTRFAVDTPIKPQKTGNIIGQSIRKLVGKIRSASAERKAKQRAKRSPSPTYQQAQLIDSNISGSGGSMDRPVQRYYLGEDPFGGSIYGRENKYDGVKPARTSRRHKEEIREERRSQSTLGRFSKSTGRLVVNEDQRNSQTLPRHISKHHEEPRNGTINVSIINTVSSPRTGVVLEGPAKPARTYKSNLSRSKSLNVHAGLDPRRPNMYTSNPQLNRLEEKPIGLKSPGLISSLNRGSQRDVTTRFDTRNGFHGERVPFKSTISKSPDIFKTFEEDDKNWRINSYNIYEPPTRLRDTVRVASPALRRGSSSSTDYSETYHTTTRNENPLRPSVTNTTKSFTKKTIPSKDGRTTETIQSSEVKSVTKSHYRGEPVTNFYNERQYSSPSPVVIEVRNYRK